MKKYLLSIRLDEVSNKNLDSLSFILRCSKSEVIRILINSKVRDLENDEALNEAVKQMNQLRGDLYE